MEIGKTMDNKATEQELMEYLYAIGAKEVYNGVGYFDLAAVGSTWIFFVHI